MNRTHTAASAPESYGTFWDAAPIEADPQAGASASPPADAYAEFHARNESGRPVSLSVEQTDVG